MDETNSSRLQGLLDVLTTEIARVLGTLLDTRVAAVPSDARVEPGWMVRLTFSGSMSGHLLIGISREDASRLARRITGSDAPPSDVDVGDALRELVGQAIASLTQSDAASGVRADIELVPLGDEPATPPVTYDLAMAGEFVPRIALWPGLSYTVAAPSEPATGRSARGETPASPPNLDVILDIDLPLAVRFGQSEMTLLALSRLGPGSVIDLGRSPDDPVDVLVNGKMIARGEVVVVAGNYGVRIIEVISAAERIRSMGA